MFSEYDTFVLKEPLSDTSLVAGARGVVLIVLGGEPTAYEVEFSDGKGGNLGDEATYTITENYMQPD